MKSKRLFCMKPVMLLLYLVTAFFLYSVYWQKKEHQPYKTATPGKFLSEWVSYTKLKGKTVVLLDLDDTVFSAPPDSTIRPDIFYNLKQEEISKNPKLTEREAEIRITPLLRSAFAKLSYQLTDKELPQVINTLKEKNITVAAITARDEKMAPETLAWLDRLHIKFSSIPDERIILAESNVPVCIKNGVAFVGSNKKGNVVTSLIKMGRLGKPANMLFMDDRAEHVENVAKSVAAYDNKIKFFPVFCTYPEIFKPYDGELTKKALARFLADNYTDEKVKALLDADPYTREIVEKQRIFHKDNKVLHGLPVAKNNERFNDRNLGLTGNAVRESS